ncbi:MAG: hypothetical protein ACOYK6_04155 [Chthoniobacterales bacterium]
MLTKLDENLASGTFIIPAVHWADVHSLAERLSAKHAFTHGYYTLDVLHIATAIHIDATTFISFDQKQRILAKKEGLRVLGS